MTRAGFDAKPQGEGADVRKSYSRIPPRTDEQLRQINANYYGQIFPIDHNVGRIIDALETQGLAESSVVINISDYGDWLEEHGLILNGPMHYDGLLKMPLIMGGPGVPAGGCVGDPVSAIDLLATSADLADTKPLQHTHGQSLRRLWAERVRATLR